MVITGQTSDATNVLITRRLTCLTKKVKRITASALLVCALCSTSFAVIFFPIDAPQDIREARAWAAERPELKPLQDEYCDIIKTRLGPLPPVRLGLGLE